MMLIYFLAAIVLICLSVLFIIKRLQSDKPVKNFEERYRDSNDTYLPIDLPLDGTGANNTNIEESKIKVVENDLRYEDVKIDVPPIKEEKHTFLVQLRNWLEGHSEVRYHVDYGVQNHDLLINKITEGPLLEIDEAYTEAIVTMDMPTIIELIKHIFTIQNQASLWDIGDALFERLVNGSGIVPLAFENIDSIGFFSRSLYLTALPAGTKGDYVVTLTVMKAYSGNVDKSRTLNIPIIGLPVLEHINSILSTTNVPNKNSETISILMTLLPYVLSQPKIPTTLKYVPSVEDFTFQKKHSKIIESKLVLKISNQQFKVFKREDSLIRLESSVGRTVLDIVDSSDTHVNFILNKHRKVCPLSEFSTDVKFRVNITQNYDGITDEATITISVKTP